MKYIRPGTFFAWDPLAAVYLVEPAVVKLQHASLGVEVMLNEPEIGRTKCSCYSVATAADPNHNDLNISTTTTSCNSSSSSSSDNVLSINSIHLSNYTNSNGSSIYVAMDADADKFFLVFCNAFYIP